MNEKKDIGRQGNARDRIYRASIKWFSFPCEQVVTVQG